MAINTTITTLPTAPSSADPTTFNARADALIAALSTLVTQINAFSSDANSTQTAINASQADVLNNASAAASASLVAIGASNFKGDWSSATAYTTGQSVSYLGQRFIAKVSSTNVVPVDGATWLLITDTTHQSTQAFLSLGGI